jgi:hypothetical protein
MEAIPLPQLRLDEFIYELQEAPVEKIVVLPRSGKWGPAEARFWVRNARLKATRRVVIDWRRALHLRLRKLKGSLLANVELIYHFQHRRASLCMRG